MKRFEVVIKGKYEKEIGLEILSGIYAAVQNHGYTDVSVQAETVEEKPNGSFWVPDFMKKRGTETGSCSGAERR